MSKKAGMKRPKWLQDYRKRTKIIEVIDMAYDSEYTDKQVRDALREAGKELGEAFMSGAPMPGTPTV